MNENENYLKDDKPFVSIFMLTYNQENYIAQAIEGVLMQKTNYKFEIVIGEDGSTDGTRLICEDYKKKFPEKIRLLTFEKNVGLIRNYVRTYKECRGKYVAICDGDDYWCDPFKIQRQVDKLEKNPEILIVFSNLNLLLPSGKMSITRPLEIPQLTDFKDLIRGNYIHSVTVMFHNKSLTSDIEKWILGYPYGDWQTYLWVLSQTGKIFYENKITAVYRKNIGISSGIMRKKAGLGEINLNILKEIEHNQKFKHRKDSITRSIIEHKTKLMGSYNKDKKFLRSFSLMISLLLKRGDLFIFKLYFHSLKRTFFQH